MKKQEIVISRVVNLEIVISRVVNL